MDVATDFDEATKKWLEKKPTRFAIEIEGVCKYAFDEDGLSVSMEDFVNLLCELNKRFDCKTFGIQHRGESLPPEEVEERLLAELHPLRRIELEKGYKPYHYHLVVMCNKSIRNGTMAKEICEILNLPFKVLVGDTLMVNPAIHMQEAHDGCIGIIRYLTHIDSPDKKLFNVEDVVTNDAPYLRFCMECDGGFVSANSLVRVIAICEGRKSKVMEMVGLAFYNRYRWSIIDLIKEGSWNEVRL